MTVRALAMPSAAVPVVLAKETIALINALWEPAWLVDDQTLRVVAVNDPALKLLGRDRGEVIGLSADA